LYQLAVSAGATEGVAPGIGPAGAELVYLRLGTRSPTIRSQDVDGASVSMEQISLAVRLIGDETFRATVGDPCSYCDFHRVCPAQEAGASILTEEKP
ncbi:MAG: PD-(D/E)XK nuclease family protein, partial [Aeromicrobium sp.]